MEPTNTTLYYSLRGLREAVEILVDRWGVSHIHASSTDDVFFAQGFNAARDRLWQIDLWRRRGLGLLSESFGPGFVEKDRAARLFLYRGDMRGEWRSYGPNAERTVTAFVSGVNEYVRLTEEDADLLPEEFRVAGYRPAKWSPQDIPRIRSHGLYKNVASEVERARTLRDFGPEAETLRSRLEPPHELSVPEDLDLSSIPDDVLDVYELATTPPVFMEDPTRVEKSQEGSNNWAISPSHTASGRPILANDPHRAQSVPSLRYIVHLSTPGMNIIGAGEPALPGISVGHNDKVAFGLTIFSMDQEDLYVYETNPANPNEYRYRTRWEPMEIERQIILVRDGESVEVELKFTRHGPVIYEDTDRNSAFVVRAAWLEAGMAPYLGSMDYMRAKSWDEFRAALNHWGSPGENQLYADTDGNIGWKPAGLVPIRPNWDGLLPVPGDGRYEWDGFMNADELPEEFNPVSGWLATANEMNLPGDYTTKSKNIGFEWYAPFRKQRIDEVLESSTDHTIEGSLRLQTDYLSVPARRIIRFLERLRPDETDLLWALEMLLGWDCVLSADSTAAAFFEVWYRLHLRPALRKRALSGYVVPDKLESALAAVLPEEDQTGDARIDLDLVENPENSFDPRTRQEFDRILLSSFREAIRHLDHLLGEDRNTWRWGCLHRAHLIHPLSGLGGKEAPKRWDIGPVPRGGSGDTVGNTAYQAEGFLQTGGSSFRVVMDVGQWDRSVAMNSPGQSGDPQSGHYADLFAKWGEDLAFPLLYSRRKIEAETERRIVLEGV